MGTPDVSIDREDANGREEARQLRLPRALGAAVATPGVVIPLGVLALWWRRRRHLPRRVGAGMFLIVHDALPWALSTLTRRRGWSARGPGVWNLLGLPLVAAGNALALWGFGLHSAESPKGLEWTERHGYFLRRGPYTISRNPMYIGELALWLGWAIFHGSAAVLIGSCLEWIAFRFSIVPREERVLEEQFGEAYLAYKARVPRWIGPPRPKTQPAPDREP